MNRIRTHESVSHGKHELPRVLELRDGASYIVHHKPHVTALTVGELCTTRERPGERLVLGERGRGVSDGVGFAKTTGTVVNGTLSRADAPAPADGEGVGVEGRETGGG